MKNYYEIFDIDETLDCDELKKELIKRQKKLIVRQNAADINKRQEAELKLALIQDARDILLDEERRREYDEKLEGFRNSNSDGTESYDQQEGDLEGRESFEELTELAHELIDQEQYPQAINVVRQALDIDDKSYYAWSLYGFASRAWRDYDEAIMAYKNALRIDSVNLNAYIELGYIYLDTDNLSGARDMVAKALHIDSNDKEVRELQAYIYMKDGSYSEAAQIYEDLLNVNPESVENKNHLAACYRDIGLSHLYYNSSNSMYYAVDKEDTEKMMDYMTRANELSPESYYEKQLAYGKKALSKKPDTSNWPSLVLAVILGLFFDSTLLLLLLVGIVIYFNYIPNYKLIRRDIFGEKTVGDRIGYFSSGTYRVMKYVIIGIAGFFLLIISSVLS